MSFNSDWKANKAIVNYSEKIHLKKICPKYSKNI